MLEQLIQRLEHRAGSLALTIHRPRKGDWQITAFRDHDLIDEVIYLSGHGDTLADAIHDFLAEPQLA